MKSAKGRKKIGGVWHVQVRCRRCHGMVWVQSAAEQRDPDVLMQDTKEARSLYVCDWCAEPKIMPPGRPEPPHRHEDN